MAGSEPFLLSARDIDPFISHIERHLMESGRDATPIFHPLSQTSRSSEKYRKSVLERWSLSLNEPDWERAWAIRFGDEIVAHLDLRGDKLPTGSHRAILGMGIEMAYRRQGIGSLLLKNAIAWAREQEFLRWIDLQVFSANAPARALYRKFGFQEVGVVQDRFRVQGKSMDDVIMTIEL